MSSMSKDLKEIVKTSHSTGGRVAPSGHQEPCDSSSNFLFEQEDYGDQQQLLQQTSTASNNFTIASTITSTTPPPGSSNRQPPAATRSAVSNPPCPPDEQDPLPTAKFLTSCCLTGDLPPFFCDDRSATNSTPRHSSPYGGGDIKTSGKNDEECWQRHSSPFYYDAAGHKSIRRRRRTRSRSRSRRAAALVFSASQGH